MALTNLAEYATQFPLNDLDLVLDFSCDDRSTNADIPGFIRLLTGG